VTLLIVSTAVITGIIGFTYSSFFEWFNHRYLMHEKHFPLHDAFRGHTMVHHQIYKWDKTFEAQGPGKPPHVALRWYAFPLMMIFHLPFFFLFQWLIGLAIPAMRGTPIAMGLFVGCVIYFTGYEYTHYLMHVPKGHHVERYRWFRFIKEHHRLHHKYMLRNLNVFIPLADLCFGTLVTSEGWRSKPAKRQRILAGRKTATPPAQSKTPADTNS
jgi:sterol desaturase/sphingolipid hydroxylase (fatty acid hydroxylase superfamily)